jgi:hypothetical protein
MDHPRLRVADEISAVVERHQRPALADLEELHPERVAVRDRLDELARDARLSLRYRSRGPPAATGTSPQNRAEINAGRQVRPAPRVARTGGR